MMSTPELPALSERSSLRGQVIDALRAALVTGQLVAGQVYSAPALAARFGVSATPVREAMLQLARDGLVITVPNKGFRVRELSDAELDELTEIRMLLEVPTTVRAIDAATAEDLAGLQRIADGLLAAALEEDLIGYVEHDRQFHRALLALAGNQQLVEIVTQLRTRARLYGLHRLAERGELTASAQEHGAMVDLIRTGDRDGLARLIRRHIGHVRGSWAGRPEPAA